MVRVRMAFETPKSSTSVQKARDFTRKIYNENIGGSRLISFYRGFSISMLGIIPYGGVSFLTHNYLIEAARTYFPKYAEIDRSAEPHKKRNRTKKDMRAWAELTAGGLSGIVAQTSSYPFELVRRRMQIGGINSPSKLLKAKDVVASIYKAEGVRGFFVGLTIGYIKVLPMFAVSFYTYEKLKSMLDIE
ncbi:putative mitochondrial carrier [Zancudomyces culisetae]|uniref:Putative mitochondrial carrier n=1 Tax=Zancudomyces culisetae TaxID=1213189 RepID=A0A1R1PGD4_ZANCU|nr:putative mitochondrial carrier [Zancudomyces culisetae]|eukprot:OMH79989.1 putative mitochondrial carrier [Zancudomyces culisetae]